MKFLQDVEHLNRFEEAATAWVCDGYTLDMRFIARNQQSDEPAILWDAWIGLSPVPRKDDRTFILEATNTLAALYANAQAAFLDGNDYCQLSGPQKLGYIEGSIDGQLPAGAMARVKLGRVDQLAQCLATMRTNSIQVRAIVDRYVEANHEYWGDRMTNTVWLAMRDTCQKAGSPLD